MSRSLRANKSKSCKVDAARSGVGAVRGGWGRTGSRIQSSQRCMCQETKNNEAVAAQAQAAAAWTTPDWAGLALAAPAPMGPAAHSVLLFVGVNSNERPDLNLKEEHKRVQAALDAAYGRASAHKPVLKHVAYSTWAEVLDEIQHERPTVLHLGFPSEHQTGIQLFRDTVQPERMLSAITAWNKLAARNGGTDLRYCAECLRVRRARAEARRVYRI